MCVGGGGADKEKGVIITERSTGGGGTRLYAPGLLLFLYFVWGKKAT